MVEILFVSLILKNDKPLYIQSFDHPDEDPASPQAANRFLKYNFLSHMALDVFASPMSLNLREQQGDQDGVLLLFVQDEVTVYGMETNTGLKFVAGVTGEIVLRPKIKLLFSEIHKCYLRTVCNPFTDLLKAKDDENMLQNDLFDQRIKEIAAKWHT